MWLPALDGGARQVRDSIIPTCRVMGRGSSPCSRGEGGHGFRRCPSTATTTRYRYLFRHLAIRSVHRDGHATEKRWLLRFTHRMVDVVSCCTILERGADAISPL